MTDQEAYKLIGERAEELSRRIDIQEIMIRINQSSGKKAAYTYLYNLAIATLFIN